MEKSFPDRTELPRAIDDEAPEAGEPAAAVIEMEQFTRYDEALATSLMDLVKTKKHHLLLPTFHNYHKLLSDRGYWYMLGTIWGHAADMKDNPQWLALFASKRPYRAISMMTPEELTVIESLAPLVAGYRPQCKSGGLHPFIFCADAKTAVRHATAMDADHVGCYSIPAHAVIAYFERFRGPEVLVLDCTDVKLEDLTPMVSLS